MGTDNENETLNAMMQFVGLCNGQTDNKTIQELKIDRVMGKCGINHITGEQLHSALAKIKNADKEIIEEFDDTLLDGLE